MGSTATAPAPSSPPQLPHSTHRWVLGARPRTLPAAFAPVLVGTALAAEAGHIDLLRAALALVVALALQIGVNYANDVSDGVRGTDHPGRIGPPRLVASGLASPKEVWGATAIAFAIAALAGALLAVLVNPWLLLIGVASFPAALLYTGGPRPYGYAGFGELMVFIFFGLVATLGTAYVQDPHLAPNAAYGAIAVGFGTVAILLANNIRDRPTDLGSAKRTLAVRLGERGSQRLYRACFGAMFLAALACAPARPGVLLTLLAVPFAVRAAILLRGAGPTDRIAALAATGLTQLLFSILFTIGFFLG